MKAHSIWITAALASAFALGAVEVGAQTITLSAEADTSVRTDLDVARNDNRGCEWVLYVGTGRGGNGQPYGAPDAMRTLVRFDMSALPAGDVVERAVLELTVSGYDNGLPTSVYNVDVHRIVDSGALTPWLEGNGLHSPGPNVPQCVGVDPAFGVAWSGVGDGGDDNNLSQPGFDPTVLASAVVNQATDGAGTVVRWDVTSLARAWADGTISNQGVMLRDVTTDGSFRGVLFGSREALAYEFPNGVAGPRLVITAGPRRVDIDVRPGSASNPVNPRAAGVLPVAVLSSPTFDARTLDPATLTLAGAAVRQARWGNYLCHAEAVNGDALPDLICQVENRALSLAQGQTRVTLEARTFAGQRVRGEDTIVIVP